MNMSGARKKNSRTFDKISLSNAIVSHKEIYFFSVRKKSDNNTKKYEPLHQTMTTWIFVIHINFVLCGWKLINAGNKFSQARTRNIQQFMFRATNRHNNLSEMNLKFVIFYVFLLAKFLYDLAPSIFYINVENWAYNEEKKNRWHINYHSANSDLLVKILY